MAKKIYRGLTSQQENSAGFSVRDTRRLSEKLYEFFMIRFVGLIILLILSVFSFLYSDFSDVFFLVGSLYFCYIFFSKIYLPFKLPVFSKFHDSNNKKPGSQLPGKAKGIYFLGNENNSNKQLWFSDDDIRTHALIFGSTGSGKTESLISMAYNALMQNSGFIYVDGKGDNTLYAKIFSMVRNMGREDDLLVINFMTGGNDILSESNLNLSNTINPFASGSSSMLSQLVVSMMDSSGQNSGGDMWKGRAISFIESIMKILVFLRDKKLILLDVDLIRKYFTIESLESLFFNSKIILNNGCEVESEIKIPDEIKSPLHNYLLSLPGFQMSKKFEQDSKVYEQHGYIVMQLTRIFSSLADVYGHIMKCSLAEVDFTDVILNRRILVVLLPALEKAPDELANLGKLIISCLKSMLAKGLGSEIQGERADIIESKPSNSESPYLCILDEYGYYAVEGFAVVPAQARSLGFSVVFAGQDLPAFQKASKEEAASICANTNIKICMKLEDPTETWEFFSKLSGEAYVTTARSFNVAQDSLTMGYQDSREAGVEKRARIDLMDLKDQSQGECHVFFRDKIIRSQMFYANPPLCKVIAVNEFLAIDILENNICSKLSHVYDKNIINPQSKYTEPKVLSKSLDKTLSYLSNNEGGDLGDNCLFLLEDEKEIEKLREEHNGVRSNESTSFSLYHEFEVSDFIDTDIFNIELSNYDRSMVNKEFLNDISYQYTLLTTEDANSAKAISINILDIINDSQLFNIKNCTVDQMSEWLNDCLKLMD